MAEHLAQMGPMLILAGLAAGIGCAAAALMIIAQRSFWRAARLGT
jgi:hypothetical protein